jgi:hypothetical protein
LAESILLHQFVKRVEINDRRKTFQEENPAAEDDAPA